MIKLKYLNCIKVIAIVFVFEIFIVFVIVFKYYAMYLDPSLVHTTIFKITCIVFRASGEFIINIHNLTCNAKVKTTIAKNSKEQDSAIVYRFYHYYLGAALPIYVQLDFSWQRCVQQPVGTYSSLPKYVPCINHQTKIYNNKTKYF